MKLSTLSARKKIILIFTGIIVTSLVVFLILLLKPTEQSGGVNNVPSNIGSEEYLIENPGLPKNEWQRKINIQTKGDVQTITNLYDGYQITIPNYWSINENVTGGLGGLSIAYGQGEDYESGETVQHIDTDLVMTVFVFDNPENLTMNKWISISEKTVGILKGSNFKQTQITPYLIFKTEKPLLRDMFVDNRIVETPIEDTLSAKYIVKDSDVSTVYVLVCTIYNDVTLLSPECENAISGFEILKPDSN